MKTNDIVKKYWFVGLIAILLIVFVVAYSSNTVKAKGTEVSTLSKDGKDLIYSFNDDTFLYADDLYQKLYESSGANIAFISLVHEMVDQYVPTTDELTMAATNIASSILQSYDDETLTYELTRTGYKSKDDLTDYCLFMSKYQSIYEDLYINQAETYTQPTVDLEDPRIASHILIKVENIEEIENEDGTKTYKLNPTSEETKKLNDCKAALDKKDKEFAEIAKEYSDDTGSGSDGGYLGVVFKSYNDYAQSPFVEEFLEGAMNANKETGEPLVVESRYGYHIIKAEPIAIDALVTDQTFMSVVENNNPDLIIKTVIKKIEDDVLTINDVKVKEIIDEYKAEE